MNVVIIGNATLDIICKTVNDVPRYDSISFEQSCVSPGGCGSNVAVGLCALGIKTALVAWIGADEAATIAMQYWRRVGLDLGFIRQVHDYATGISVGLIDSEAQPRFIHTPGANQLLTVDGIDVEAYAAAGAGFLHLTGYFVLPGLLDLRLSDSLSKARSLGLFTSLDVVRSPRMGDPEPLWACLPNLDLLMCNGYEGWLLTGIDTPDSAARRLRDCGAKAVVIKLGKDGCWLEADGYSSRIPTEPVPVIDTTGAGDAFAAGLLASLVKGETLSLACKAGNVAGSRIVQSLGAISGWFSQ